MAFNYAISPAFQASINEINRLRKETKPTKDIYSSPNDYAVNHLLDLIHESNMTYASVVKRAGLSKNAIFNMKNNDIRISSLNALANVFGYKVVLQKRSTR
jgi:hypothetical protein